MKVIKIEPIEYNSFIYTPQVEGNENYFLDSGALSKNCQNISQKSMSTILTRIDKDCKVVIIGSNTQIDNQYINKYNNALTVLQNAVKNPSIINTWGGELINVVRGPITEFAEQIFNKDSKQEPETMKSFVDSGVSTLEGIQIRRT